MRSLPFSVCFVTLLLQISGSVEQTMSKCTSNSKLCCPCYAEELSCNASCPTTLLPVLQCGVTCPADPSRTTTTTEPTNITDTINTTVTMTTVTSKSGDRTRAPVTTEAPCSPSDEVRTCMVGCPSGFYHDTAQTRCISCAEKCIECEHTASNCSQCKYSYQGNCYPTCPNNTKEDGGIDGTTTIKCIDDPESKPEENKLGIYLGAGIGGGVAFILIIIVIIGCCRRYRMERSLRRHPATQRTAMSEILGSREGTLEEDKDKPAVPEPQTTNSLSRRPHDYTNTHTLPVGIGQAVQIGHDKVTRYTQDPTSNGKNGNKTKVATADPAAELVEDELYGNDEIAELQKQQDTANMTPDQMVEMVELGKLPAAPPVPTAQVNTDPIPGSSDDQAYMNMDFHAKSKKKEQTKNKKAAAKSVKSSPARENVTQASKGDDSDLEDYENTKQFKKEKGTNGEKDYEDSLSRKKKDKPENQREDDLLTYENVLQQDTTYENVVYKKD